MEKLLASIGIALGVFIVIFISAFIGGTCVFLLWPVAIPAMLPGLVASGVIAAKLTWWQAVCLSWLFGLLIKTTSANATSTTEKK